MSAREKILAALAANKPALVAKPVLSLSNEERGETLLSKFTTTLEGISGKVIVADTIADVQAAFSAAMANGDFIVNTMIELGTVNQEIDSASTAAFLSGVETAFIKGHIAVAENGAIWVKENDMKNRLLPFICQHLVLVIDTGSIVPTMHEAYGTIKIDEEGFGVFIAGPSKTADIEQSLVIGAHGARSLTVYVVAAR